MSEKWVAYDAISGDVMADGQERQIRKYRDSIDEATDGQHTVVIATESEWRRVAKRNAFGMSSNPPRRNPASIEHL